MAKSCHKKAQKSQKGASGLVVFELYGVDQEFAGVLQCSQPLAFFDGWLGFRVCVEEVLDHLISGRIRDEALRLRTGELL